jgi:hypothetical protein
MSGTGWCRVTRSAPCPVCLKTDWCTVAADGSVACCMRVESPRTLRNGGWLHRLRDTRERRQPERTRYLRVPQLRPSADLSAMAARYRAAVNPAELVKLAAILGVSGDALIRLGIGWDGPAWTFPMSDPSGAVVGIRRRFPDGRKLSVAGGHEGLFVPEGVPPGGLLLICEGPTDTAAMLTLGFSALGRPSCRGGVQFTCEVARSRPVAVIGDGDEPGRRGAQSLARLLRLHCPDVRVVYPPTSLKDARQWLCAGASRADVQRAIEAAQPTCICVKVTRRPRIGRLSKGKIRV